MAPSLRKEAVMIQTADAEDAAQEDSLVGIHAQVLGKFAASW
jgi:hypothetical protein